MTRLGAVAVGVAMITAVPLGAQQRGLQITPAPESRVTVQGPNVAAVGVLGTGRLQDYITSGFPARLNFTIELWSRETFDQLVAGPAGWSIIVTYDQLASEFTIAREIAGVRTKDGPFRRFSDVEAAIAKPVEAPLRAPMTDARLYYRVKLEIVKVDLKDLDELKRWWGIEVKPAAQGKRSLLGAVWRGVETLFLRMLGGANPVYETISATFTPRIAEDSEQWRRGLSNGLALSPGGGRR